MCLFILSSIIPEINYLCKSALRKMDIEIIDNERFSEVWVDGERWKEVHRRLYKKHLKEILRTQTKKELSDLLLEIDVKIARAIVYKALALRGHLKAELKKKLQTVKITPQAIEKILAECEALGYLDDTREGKLFIQREKRRGLGPQMIAYKLKQKAPELADMVSQEVSEQEQIAQIKKWIEKKTKRSNPQDLKVKGRLYRFLRGKGFDDSLIRRAIAD